MRRSSVALAAILLTACGSPLAGGWQGTMDLGPVDAPAWTLRIAEDGRTGRLEIKEPGKAFERFELCKLSLQGRAFVAEYDANRPTCDGPDASDRRVLRGTAGEGVISGEVFGPGSGDQTGPKLGFFRAFRLPTP